LSTEGKWNLHNNRINTDCKGGFPLSLVLLQKVHFVSACRHGGNNMFLPVPKKCVIMLAINYVSASSGWPITLAAGYTER